VTEALGGKSHTHLFAAQNEDRYLRQGLIKEYEALTGARLIVMMDQVFSHGVTLLEELLTGLDGTQDLHLMLATPGGDGEVAVRLVRAMQARCKELTIIVPDMAKSAGTIMCLGAHKIVMSPSSDLGPIDPQFRLEGRLVGAKEIVAAVDEAEKRVQQNSESYALYSGLLSDVNMVMVEQARSAVKRSYSLMREALTCSGRSAKECATLEKSLKKPLIDEAHYHGATIGPEAAQAIGLPVEIAQTSSDEWQLIWALWARYFTLGVWPRSEAVPVYESNSASQVLRPA